MDAPGHWRTPPGQGARGRVTGAGCNQAGAARVYLDKRNLRGNSANLQEIDMKKLLAIAILGLSTSGLVLADDIGDFSYVKSTVGVAFDGQTLGRADAPTPVPTINMDGVAEGHDWARRELEANG